MIDLENQVAVITGAGRGLGRLYALELARRGAAVVVNDLGGDSRGAGNNPGVAEQVAIEIAEAGGRAVASHHSVSTAEGGEAIVRAALDTFGRVDILVNNAGIFEFSVFEELAVAAWKRMLNVHLDGSFHVSQPAFRAMKSQGYGRLVFISSSAGMFGQAGNAHYGTAKAGLVGLANTLALEGAKHGILANTVLPTGYSRMVSEQISGRTISAGQKAFYQAIDPDLVVPLVVYLASRNCSLTHHNVAACAGRYSRVFVGLSEGWLSPANTRPSAEDIASQITAIIDTDKFSIPGALYEEVAETCAMRGFDLAG